MLVAQRVADCYSDLMCVELRIQTINSATRVCGETDRRLSARRGDGVRVGAGVRIADHFAVSLPLLLLLCTKRASRAQQQSVSPLLQCVGDVHCGVQLRAALAGCVSSLLLLLLWSVCCSAWLIVLCFAFPVQMHGVLFLCMT